MRPSAIPSLDKIKMNNKTGAFVRKVSHDNTSMDSQMRVSMQSSVQDRSNMIKTAMGYRFRDNCNRSGNRQHEWLDAKINQTSHSRKEGRRNQMKNNSMESLRNSGEDLHSLDYMRGIERPTTTMELS